MSSLIEIEKLPFELSELLEALGEINHLLYFQYDLAINISLLPFFFQYKKVRKRKRKIELLKRIAENLQKYQCEVVSIIKQNSLEFYAQDKERVLSLWKNSARSIEDFRLEELLNLAAHISLFSSQQLEFALVLSNLEPQKDTIQ